MFLKTIQYFICFPVDLTFKILYFIKIFRKSLQSLSSTVDSPLYSRSTRYNLFFKLSSHMDQFIINIEFLSSVWNMSLKWYSQTPEPHCVLWSFHYCHWPGSHSRPPPVVAYFSTFYLHFSKICASLVISCFIDLTTKHFTRKQEYWILF